MRGALDDGDTAATRAPPRHSANAPSLSNWRAGRQASAVRDGKEEDAPDTQLGAVDAGFNDDDCVVGMGRLRREHVEGRWEDCRRTWAERCS